MAIINAFLHPENNNNSDKRKNTMITRKKSANGLIEPAKVSRVALQHAASIAGMLLTTEALVAEEPAEDDAPAPAMPDGGGMY